MTDNLVAFPETPSAIGIAAPPDPQPDFAAQVALIQKWRKILACRWLAFIALIGALSIWSYATIDPTPWRFGVSVGYSALVLIPTFGLYFFRSE